MDEIGQIEIRVSGQQGKNPLSPDNFDIREIQDLFGIVENLLYPQKKANRAPITYTIQTGSVRNIFKTTLQSATMFFAVMSLVESQKSLDGLDIPVARALQEIQKSAVRNNYTYEFGNPDEDTPKLTISSSTNYRVKEELWTDAEFYFYGTLINAGGKEHANIHLDTKDNSVLTIATDRDFLEYKEDNVLYKFFAVRAIGKQNVNTGEIDQSSLKLLEMGRFEPKFDEVYLNRLIGQASKHWTEIDDVDGWVAKIRGIDG